MIDSIGSTTYTYDNRGRCISEEKIIEGDQYTLSYAYDAASRLISTTYPDQSIITYEYDSLNRLVAIPGYVTFTYSADSLPTSATYGNGITTNYQYDTCDRPLHILAQRNDTDILSMSYQYDAVGNIIQRSYERELPDQQWAQSTETFQYDWLDRLVFAQGDYGSLSYSYDPLGNRLSQNDLVYSYNAMNELISISNGTTFDYDENGSMMTKIDGVNTWSYTYDKRHFLTQVEKNQQVLAQFDYDGNNRRIKKTEWVESLQEYQTMIYIYSGTNIIYEKNLNTDSYATYVHGPTGKIAKNIGGMIGYYHTDRIGSTRIITDESGNVITELNYVPFGECILNGEEEKYLFTSKEKDVTGLYYFDARYYDPEIGRFITKDAMKGDIRNPQSLNRYSYCLNNPIRYHDPLGFEEQDGEDDGQSPEDIVNEIFQYLFNMGLEELSTDIDSYFVDEEGNALDPLDGIKKLLDDLGFTCKKIKVNDNEALEIEICVGGINTKTHLYYDEDMKGHYGYAPPNTIKIYIGNKENFTTVADMASTILHEMCHRVLEITHPDLNTCQQHSYIYPAHVSFITRLNNLGYKYRGEGDLYYPFSEEYTKKHEENLKQYGSGDCQEKGFCLGSLVLGIFIFLGLFLTQILKREELY